MQKLSSAILNAKWEQLETWKQNYTGTGLYTKEISQLEREYNTMKKRYNDQCMRSEDKEFFKTASEDSLKKFIETEKRFLSGYQAELPLTSDKSQKASIQRNIRRFKIRIAGAERALIRRFA